MASEFNRRRFLEISGAAMMTGALSRQAAGDQAPPSPENASGSARAAGQRTNLAKRPNIILFQPDELRADSLACFGNPLTKTPNFDRLAAEGAKFTNCQVQYPVCGASRCSFLTGWPTSVRGHRSLYYFLRPYEPNLFRYLKEGGYDVYWYGKNDALAAASFYGSVTEWSEVGKGGRARVSGAPGVMSGGTPMPDDFLFPPTGDRRDENDYRLVLSAIDILERKETDRPFCIFLPLINPHPPYSCPADFYNMYSPDDVPAPIPPGLPRRPNFHQRIRERYGITHVREATFRKIKAVYYGKVSFQDWVLGQLLEALYRTHHDKDTAVICFSDHGDYTGDYGLVEKWPSGLEDVLTHTPMIARVPGGLPGVESHDMIENFDMMATCLDLAGIQARHTHFARSLLPQVSGKPGDPHRAAFCEGGYNVYEPQCYEPLTTGGVYAPKVQLQNEEPDTITRCAMVRTQDAKLIVRPQGQNELYVYKTDQREENNVFGQSGVAALQQELQTRLTHWYINTTGIAPFDKDARNAPPDTPGRIPPEPGWPEAILDK
jgi:arylsulfatase A-like enzyme